MMTTQKRNEGIERWVALVAAGILAAMMVISVAQALIY